MFLTVSTIPCHSFTSPSHTFPDEPSRNPSPKNKSRGQPLSSKTRNFQYFLSAMMISMIRMDTMPPQNGQHSFGLVSVQTPVSSTLNRLPLPGGIVPACIDFLPSAEVGGFLSHVRQSPIRRVFPHVWQGLAFQRNLPVKHRFRGKRVPPRPRHRPCRLCVSRGRGCSWPR